MSLLFCSYLAAASIRHIIIAINTKYNNIQIIDIGPINGLGWTSEQEKSFERQTNQQLETFSTNTKSWEAILIGAPAHKEHKH